MLRVFYNQSEDHKYIYRSLSFTLLLLYGLVCWKRSFKQQSYRWETNFYFPKHNNNKAKLTDCTINEQIVHYGGIQNFHKLL